MRTLLSPLILILSLPGASWAQETLSDSAQKARKIAEHHKDSILSVKIILKYTESFGGRQDNPDELKLEVNGTNIKENGLVVVSNSQIDPFAWRKEAVSDFFSGEDDPSFKAHTSVEDVKIVLNDGKEIDAEIVLKDKDLDLAFIRPKSTKGVKLPHLELKVAPDPKPLDEYVTISRMDRSSERALVVDIDRMRSIVKKPRIYYIAGTSHTGCPAFDMSGNVLGMFLNRPERPRARRSYAYYPSGTTILPTEDILEVLKQVPESEKEEKKKE